MLFWATLDTDILGPNVYGSGSLDSYLPNTRADNAIAYKGKFGGLTAGATYSFGRDTVNAGPSPSGTNCAGENPADVRACREWSAMLMYETNWWGLSAAYDSLRGGPGAFGGLTKSSLTDNRLSLGGYMLLANTKLGAGWLRRDNGGSPTPKSDLLYAGASYDITPPSTWPAGLLAEVPQQRQQGLAVRHPRHLRLQQAHLGLRHRRLHRQRRAARAIGQRRRRGFQSRTRREPARRDDRHQARVLSAGKARKTAARAACGARGFSEAMREQARA